MKPKVSIVKCSSYDTDEVLAGVEKALDLIGGIALFIKPGQKVLIKPNILSARPPQDGVNTHVEVIRALIRILKKQQARVLVGDSPSYFAAKDTNEVYSVSGMKQLCEDEAIELVKFDRVEQVGGAPIAKILKEVDVVISAPKMKTHNLTMLTGAVKNMFGAVVGMHKLQVHLDLPEQQAFSSRIVDIFMQVKPHLNIMDAVVGMDGDGPAGGRLRNFGLILAAQDAVALDSVFAQIANVHPFKVPIIEIANARGAGTGSPEDIEVLGERLEDVRVLDFALPRTSLIHQLPLFMLKSLGRTLKSYPVISQRKCTKCKICMNSCLAGAITVNEKVSEIDHSKCICCYCCHEMCPSNAISFKQSVFKKLLDLFFAVRRKLQGASRCLSRR